jgi:hypothetical protein
MPTEIEVEATCSLLEASARSFESLYRSSTLPDRVDSRRTGNTFYGERPDTIRKVHAHVNQVQDYYMSRLGMSIATSDVSLVARRGDCIAQLRRASADGKHRAPIIIDDERWTLSKVYRRFLWHDRIHAKAIVRILLTQLEEGAIEGFTDPFRFFE